jgi:ATP-dependent Zn protease
MSNEHIGTATPTSPAENEPNAALLRRLATRAFGMTGADIERVVREARQTARRQQRQMTFDDVEAGIRGGHAFQPYNVRWRCAVHEAGHAVVHHFLDVGQILSLTIDTHTGGHNNLTFRTGADDTVGWYQSVIAMFLAGRAAEASMLGTVSGGSGGRLESDLARATAVALSLETTLGFSEVMPLLYRDLRDTAWAMSADRALATRVNGRLETGLASATATIEANKAAFTRLTRILFDQQVVDGETATAILTSSD